MAIAFVQAGSVGNDTTGTTAPITSSLTPTAGNMLVAGSGGYQAGGVFGSTAVTDDKSDTWARKDEGCQTDACVGLFTSPNVAGGATVVTLAPSTTRYNSFVALEYSGLTTTPTQQVGTKVSWSNGSAIVVAGPSPTNNDHITIVAISIAGDGAIPAPSGWNYRANFTNYSGASATIHLFDTIQNSASADTFDTGANTYAYGEAVVIVLSVAGGGGGQPTMRRWGGVPGMRLGGGLPFVVRWG